MEVQKNKKFLEKIERAVELIESSEIDEAISHLKFCEDILDLKQEMDADLYILIFHNLSLCYQMTENLEKCKEYLEKTIILSKSCDYSQDIMKIRNFRYMSMLYIQMGAIHSFFGDSRLSLSSAQKAFKNILKSFNLCLSMGMSTKSLTQYQQENCQVLEACISYLTNQSSKLAELKFKIIRRSSLGVIHFTDWIFDYNLNDLLRVKPLKYFDIKNFHTFVAEVSKDFMLEKICLLCAACYMIASNIRALGKETTTGNDRSWHLKAVEIGKALLPFESPLFLDIKESFERHYPDISVNRPTAKTPVLESRKSIPKGKKTPEISSNNEKPKVPDHKEITKKNREKIVKSERKTHTPEFTNKTKIKEKALENNCKSFRKGKLNIIDSRRSDQRPKTPILMKPPKGKISDKKTITDRSYFNTKKKLSKIAEKEGKFKTLRDENIEPEPQISGDYRESKSIN